MIQYEETMYFYLLLLIPLMVLGYVLFSFWKKECCNRWHLQK